MEGPFIKNFCTGLRPESDRIMKCFTAACAAAAALFCAGPSPASDVTVFGMVDLSLGVWSVDSGVGGRTTKAEMLTGQYMANRIGLRGEEDLPNGLKAGFLLENGFNADSGTFKTSGVLFDRGSWLYLKSPEWGQFSAGRLGLLRSSATEFSYPVLGMRINPFGSGWGSVGSTMFLTPFHGFLGDNMMSWISPKRAGLQLHVQYGMGEEGVENKSSGNRYAALGLTFDGALADAAVVVDQLDEKHALGESQKDAFSVTMGGRIKLVDGLQLYAWTQFFKGADTIMALPGTTGLKVLSGFDDISGWTASTGLKMPVPGGRLNLMGAAMKASADDACTQSTGSRLKRYAAFAGYEHPLSKHATLYSAASFWKDVAAGSNYRNPTVLQWQTGLDYRF